MIATMVALTVTTAVVAFVVERVSSTPLWARTTRGQVLEGETRQHLLLRAVERSVCNKHEAPTDLRNVHHSESLQWSRYQNSRKTGTLTVCLHMLLLHKGFAARNLTLQQN